MSGGPLWPFAKYPITDGVVYPLVYVGGGSGSKFEEGMGLLALHGADGVWDLRFAMPPVIPSGDPKLRLFALADAATGDEDVEPSWLAIDMGVDPSSASLIGEGDTNFDWATGAQNDEYKEGVVDLDAATAPAADQIVVMKLTFKAATSSLNEESSWQAYIFWE